MLFRSNRLLSVTFLLFAVSVAHAAPAVVCCNGSSVNSVVYPILGADILVGQIVELTDLRWAAVAADFLEPPADLPVLTASPPVRAKNLPAVPGALFMVLTGFLCVSLVRDRRVWLTALAGLLWAGQFGIQALPQLALRLTHRTHGRRQAGTELAYKDDLETLYRLRSDVEGTRYIGLLHHLAGIPDAKADFKGTQPDPLTALSQRLQKAGGKLPVCLRENTSTSLAAIIAAQYLLDSSLKRLASKAQQFVCFSPAFIFDNRPRGPPEPT